MIRIAYSGKSKPTAEKIADELPEVELVRGSNANVDVNWGRNYANSELNPDISNVTNKRVMRELFDSAGVPMPKLLSTTRRNHPIFGDVIDFEGDNWQLPLVGRPDQHMKGRGFWLCRTTDDVQRAIRGTRRKKAATHFMEYVEADREYRVHVFKGKSIRISEKVYTDESKKEYTTGKPGDIKLRKIREAAKAAVSAVGLDFGAVDILARGDNNSEVFVLEVNAAPGLGGSMPKLYADVLFPYGLIYRESVGALCIY